MIAVATALALAATPCAVDAGAPRVTAEVVKQSRPGVTRTAVVACDHATGRERVLRRGAHRHDPSRGVLVGAASAAGTRVAWIEARIGRRTRSTWVVTADGATGRAVERRRVARARGTARQEMGVALTTRRELAWLAEGRLVLQRPGRRPRVLARGSYVSDLALDDDRTLRWEGRALRFFELPGRVVPGRCPIRAGWVPVLQTGAVVVTRRLYGNDPESIAWQAVRACDIGSGRDPVLLRALSQMGNGSSYDVIAASDRWVVAIRRSYSRYHGCEAATLHAVETPTGREGRPYATDCLPGQPLPAAGDPIAVTASGATAWVERGPERWRVLATGPEGRLLVLDEAPPEAIADLRAEGEEVAWSNAGQPRRARP